MIARTSKMLRDAFIRFTRSRSRFLDSAESPINGRFCSARNDKLGVDRSILTGKSGSEIAEAALVLPIAFMVLLGIYWFGRAFNVYATINHAAREGARYAVAQSCASCGNTAPLTSNISTQISQAMQASGLDPGLTSAQQTVTFPACGGGTASCQRIPIGSAGNFFCYYTGVQLVASPPSGSGGPACGVSFDFQYPFQLSLPYTSLNGQKVNLTAHVQMRTEQ